ncbi:MAG: Ada metal-binding domain-containing protein [Rhizomicrobium sp.]|jgi:AraC family transcriptional regulator of adaptative response / DNA-3-methyladenine glycosylase II
MNIKPFSWDRALAREGRYDGKFLIGVLTTGIYCLPSCAARPPKPDNVRLFKTEDEAKAAGLRACKRCRPDLFYRGEDSDISLFEGLIARVRAALENFADVHAMAQACGVSQTKLGELMRDHAHLAPAQWLRRERVRAACRQLLGSEDKIADIGFGVGFESESVFHRQFLSLTRMTPGAYRALKSSGVFLVQVPAAWRETEILAYHARDPESLCERTDGRRIIKALETPDGPAVLEVSLEADGAWCRPHSVARLGRDTMAAMHAVALRMLGLANEVSTFESRAARDGNMSSIVSRRKGLRVPLTPTGFDGLAWAIIGQQVNVKFATSLRREIITLAGTPVGGMRAHPSAERVAALDAQELTSRKFSRSKADYLIEAARQVAQGNLDAERLGDGSAVAAEKSLTRIRGIGVWTARYMLLRGAGFADCAPVGDSALATALHRLHKLDERPDAKQTEELMRQYAPHRTLATAHLWASLKDAA